MRNINEIFRHNHILLCKEQGLSLVEAHLVDVTELQKFSSQWSNKALFGVLHRLCILDCGCQYSLLLPHRAVLVVVLFWFLCLENRWFLILKEEMKLSFHTVMLQSHWCAAHSVPSTNNLEMWCFLFQSALTFLLCGLKSSLAETSVCLVMVHPCSMTCNLTAFHSSLYQRAWLFDSFWKYLLKTRDCHSNKAELGWGWVGGRISASVLWWNAAMWKSDLEQHVCRLSSWVLEVFLVFGGLDVL